MADQTLNTKAIDEIKIGITIKTQARYDRIKGERAQAKIFLVEESSKPEWHSFPRDPKNFCKDAFYWDQIHFRRRICKCKFKEKKKAKKIQRNPKP